MTEGGCLRHGCYKRATFLQMDGSLAYSADQQWPRTPNGWDTHWTGRCAEHQIGPTSPTIGQMMESLRDIEADTRIHIT